MPNEQEYCPFCALFDMAPLPVATLDSGLPAQIDGVHCCLECHAVAVSSERFRAWMLAKFEEQKRGRKQ